MELEIIILSKINQKQRHVLHALCHMWKQNKKSQPESRRGTDCKGLRGREQGTAMATVCMDGNSKGNPIDLSS
jgi:hypothetical protein